MFLYDCMHNKVVKNSLVKSYGSRRVYANAGSKYIRKFGIHGFVSG